MIALLDANALIALAVGDHQHHRSVRRWYGTHDDAVATCPITQGALVRLLLREGTPADQAREVLAAITGLARHRFWADDLGYDDVPLASLVGHRQVTDAYLAALAREHGGSLVTFDRGLSLLHSDVALLLPVRSGT